MSKVFDLTVYTNDEALLAYIDLLGTTNLYHDQRVALKDLAKMLYSALLHTFSTDFQNCFEPFEIRDRFYVNIYSDSIIICKRKPINNIVERIIEFLLLFQRNLLFNLGISIRIKNRDYEVPVPSRILIGKDKYFSLPIKALRNKSILGSKYTSVSLCGGHGMIDMDETLKRLPIGLYIIEDLIKESNIQNKRIIKTSNNLFFIKQKNEYIDSLMLYSHKNIPLREFVNNLLDRSLVKGDQVRRKWDVWISAHEGNLYYIEKEKESSE